MLVFFMFQTKANGFQVMDIGHYYGLIIIGLSFRLTVYRGLIASMGPIWRICYLILLCFVFINHVFVPFLVNSPTPQQWMLWSFFIFTLSRRCEELCCFRPYAFWSFTSTAVKSCWFFLKSTVSCKRSVAWFGSKLPVYSTTGGQYVIFLSSPRHKSG